ncbi:uncharacterized protein isoform X2 [Leptinotarsa decemlineata]|uniref:uncharacterized protein isoform X2 n=1 Tax=Leptinotarsa decemlineata TaxID=7539 RepID=UPI000C255739|nr:uncharacterized protein LOC111512349 isoform X2 [Leptinotarsa decemlineata]
MESVNKARQRYRQYPVILAKCSSEASKYATCVLKTDNIRMNDCSEEFVRFKSCLQKTARTLNTRI